MAEENGPRCEQEPLAGRHRNRKWEERLADEMAIIAEIGRVIGSSLDIDQVYERFASEVKKLIPFDRLAVNVKHPDADTFTVAHVSGMDIPGLMQGSLRPMAGTITKAVMGERTSRLVQPESTPGAITDTVSRYPAIFRGLDAGLFSIMSVPLIYRDEAIAALHFRSKKTRAYTEQDLRLAERIGAQIAGAIANARLFAELKAAEEEQRRNRENAERLSNEIAVIAEIGRVISSSLDIGEVYERFAVEAKNLIPFDRLSVNPMNPHDNDVTIAYVVGCDIPGRRPGDRAALAGTLSEIVLRTKKSLLINTQSGEELAARFPSLGPVGTVAAGMRSIICVPLISRDEVIGILHLRSRTPGTYTERDLLLAERIGMQIAGAIANAQLYSGLKKTEEALRSSEQQLTSYIEGAGDAIYILRSDTGRIVNCNSRACLDLGYSRDELLKLSATDIESKLLPGEIDAIHFDLKPGEVTTLEGRHRRKDGSEFPVEIRLNSLAPTQPELMISIVRDITERRKVEEELSGYRVHLEEMIKERTRELETKNTTLHELNTTLKVLLKQREEDKWDMEERIVMNVKSLVLPFVEQMKKGSLGVGQQACLEIIETHLNQIATPLLKNMRQFNLTPKEIKVAALVRDGKSTKEVAKILGIATGSIDIHRNNIRKKLGLNSRKANLQSHLETLEK